MTIKLAPLVNTTPEDLIRIAGQSDAMLQKVRDLLLEPLPRKTAPMVSSARLQEICGIDAQRMAYLRKKGELPGGVQARAGAPWYFTLEETSQWVSAVRQPPKRLGLGKVIAVANFKGGVTKTTMSTVLAQGLALLKGRRVCHIDLDPQGSATTLYGVNPHTEVVAAQTVLPLIEAYLSEEDLNLRGLPQPTYWPNIDLIPASTELFNAEFMLPARAASGAEGARFEDVLHRGLQPLLDEYDYIIIDTAPTLSYLTINAIFAADGIIVPVVPDALAFASMVQFWHLFSDLVSGMAERGLESRKEFNFLDILVTRMTPRPAARAVLGWISDLYGSRVIPIEIPETDVARNASMTFSTVYDFASYPGGVETLRRIRTPCDEFVEYIDEKVSRLWEQEAES